VGTSARICPSHRRYPFVSGVHWLLWRAIAITFAHVDHVTTSPLGMVWFSGPGQKGALRQLAPKNVSMHVTFSDAICNLISLPGVFGGWGVPILAAGCRLQVADSVCCLSSRIKLIPPFGSSRCEMWAPSLHCYTWPIRIAITHLTVFPPPFSELTLGLQRWKRHSFWGSGVCVGGWAGWKLPNNDLCWFWLVFQSTFFVWHRLHATPLLSLFIVSAARCAICGDYLCGANRRSAIEKVEDGQLGDKWTGHWVNWNLLWGYGLITKLCWAPSVLLILFLLVN